MTTRGSGIRYWAAQSRVDERGAAAIEFAMGAMIFLVLTIGILEFGRALYLRNSLGYAADVATRAALVNGKITESEIRTKIYEVFEQNDDELTVTLSSETAGGQAFRVVSLSYPMRLLIPLPSLDTIALGVDRRM
jgi:hypothetical protein